MTSSSAVESRVQAAILVFRGAVEKLQLPARREQDAPVAVLVDPGFHDPLASDEHVKEAPRVQVTGPGTNPAQQPYILMPAGMRAYERIVSASLRLAIEESVGVHDREGLRPRSVCAWLVPKDVQAPDWSEIARAFSARTVVVAPGSSGTRQVFRFWDPRVASQLTSAVGAAAWSECLSSLGLSQWWAVNEAGELARMDELPTPAAKSRERSSAWAFDARQWKALEFLRWRNCLSQAAYAWGVEPGPSSAVLDDIVRRALNFGLADEADIRSFAYLALAVNPRFDALHEVRLALRQWDAEGRCAGGFSARVQAWSDDFLEQLSRAEGFPAAALGAQTSSRL